MKLIIITNGVLTPFLALDPRQIHTLSRVRNDNEFKLKI